MFTLWRQILRELVLSIQDLLVKLFGILVLKGQLPANHGEQNDSAAPNVGIQPQIALSLNHFWRRIAWAATSCLESFSCFVQISQPKVHEFYVVVVVQQDVFRFQITVDYPNFMDVFNG